MEHKKRPLLLLVLVLFAALAVSASAVFEAESLYAEPVKLDLCQGTITIEGTGDSTCYTQNGTAYYSSADALSGKASPRR